MKTVREIIQALQALPNQDQRCLTPGYEGGYHDMSGKFGEGMIEIDKLKGQPWVGPHCNAWQEDDGTYLTGELCYIL